MLSWETGLSVATALLTIVLGGVLRLIGFASKCGSGKKNPWPPGPRGLPVLGYLPFIGRPYHVAFKTLSLQYGPVVRVRLGCKDVVVLNDLESIREGLANPDLLCRPNNFVFRYFGVKGILSLNGQPWRENRRYCFHVLRNLGFAKKSMEKHIQEESQCFANFLEGSKGRPTLISQALAASVANNISALLLGRRFDSDDPKGRLVQEQLTKFFQNFVVLGLTDFLPALRPLTAYISNTALHAMSQVFMELQQFLRKEVKEREANMEKYRDRDFIDGYLRKMEENSGSNSHFNMAYLEGNAMNLYGAGTNTVRANVLWNLYIAASHPDGHQERVQQEIDAVLGRHRAPTWEDRHRLPFTMASIMETMRWRASAPISVPRATERDTIIKGYHVPAGTIVVPNLWWLHNNPAYWTNPSQYDPTRFLDAGGTKVERKPQAFLPFSAGKRACPGETLGLMEVFLYVTTLLQKFRVLPEEGQDISSDVERGLIAAISTIPLRFVAR
ncbi:cytochrome P450 18a1-like [Haemaphysalis longicornis]